MVLMRGSSSGVGVGGHDRPGLTKDQIMELISSEVVIALRGSIPELFGSIKAAMIEIFDDRYSALSEATVFVATMIVDPLWFVEREPSSTDTSSIRSLQCSMECRI